MKKFFCTLELADLNMRLHIHSISLSIIINCVALAAVFVVEEWNTKVGTIQATQYHEISHTTLW